MPVLIRSLGDMYRVETPSGVKAKRTTKKKAKAQKRLLNAVEHSNWRPTKKKAKIRKRKKIG